MLQFLETGKALYVLTAVCVLGLFSRLIARNLYRRLMKETDNMTLTKNKFLRDLKQRAENNFRLNQGIRNSRAYLEKQLTGYRFLKMSLSGWGSFAGQMTILCFLLGGAASFGAYWYRCDSYYIVLYSSVGILAGLLTLVVDAWANLPDQKQQLLNSLQDYIENSLFNRLSRETASASVEEDRRSARDNIRELGRNSIRDLRRNDGRDDGGERDDGRTESRMDNLAVRRTSRSTKRQAAEKQVSGRIQETADRDIGMAVREQDSSVRDVDYLKRSLEQIAASRERNRLDAEWTKDLSQEEMELLKEILKQYLA